MTNKDLKRQVFVEHGSNIYFTQQTEGSIGYAHWVFSTLREKVKMDSDLYKYSIEKMAAIPAASDALARYTGNARTIIFEINMDFKKV